MKGYRILSIAVLLALALAVAVSPPGLAQEGATALAAPGTAFTYQGRLQHNGSPLTGSVDLQFTLWDAEAGGVQVGSAVTHAGEAVTGGLFTVQLDFGADAFDGEARWLAVSVANPPGSGYVALLPRQPLTPAPYALALPGLWTQQNATSPNLIGGHSGNWVFAGVYGATIGGGGEAGSPNSVTDNYGTVGGGLRNQAGSGPGATDDQPYATVGGGENNTASGRYATVGGGTSNKATASEATVSGGSGNTAGGVGAAIGGGYGNKATIAYATVSGGYTNTASSWYVTVGGGESNTASAMHATVGGGESNTASGSHATVGGGGGNTASGSQSTVGGGVANTASGEAGAIAGGAYNEASGQLATIAGGYANVASIGLAVTIGGGYTNEASGPEATVGGGLSNNASGDRATIPGGELNVAAGNYAFAAGRRAKANHDGSFVWADSTDADLASTAANQFLVRATGGITLYTNSGLTTGSYLAAGSGTWADASDRNLKENVVAVDGRDVLARLAGVPISTWNYTAQDASIRHIGPMAQDFFAAFQVGEDDTHITTVDADGVALAAIQGLYAENQELKAQVGELEARVAALEELAGNGPQPVAAGLFSGGWGPAGFVAAGAAVAWLARRRQA